MLGLKRSKEVKLVCHQPEWDLIAAQRIKQLWDAIGSSVIDIQHVGSTSIPHIKAKPDMLIAVGLESVNDVSEILIRLKEIGISQIPTQIETDILCALDDEIEHGVHTLYIHLLPHNSRMWRENINFRDYLADFPQKAANYEKLKIDLAAQYPTSRRDYKKGKLAFFKTHFIEAHLYKDMKQKFDIATFEPINKGWSSDQKYYIKTVDGRQFLLRVSNQEEYERKKNEFAMLKKAESLGIPLSSPIDFGLCNNNQNVYQLLTWVEGVDVREVLPRLTEKKRYELGIKMGELLSKIHSFPAFEITESWDVWFWCETSKKIDIYHSNNSVQSDRGDLLVKHLQENRALLANRSQTFNHGDFGTSNIILMPDGELGCIDFSCDVNDHGDPWWEFDSIASWGEEPCPYLYTGFINGYFDHDSPPMAFFEVLAYYFAYAALTALCETAASNQKESEEGKRHMDNILHWFNDMNDPVPTWYLQDVRHI